METHGHIWKQKENQQLHNVANSALNPPVLWLQPIPKRSNRLCPGHAQHTQIRQLPLGSLAVAVQQKWPVPVVTCWPGLIALVPLAGIHPASLPVKRSICGLVLVVGWAANFQHIISSPMPKNISSCNPGKTWTTNWIKWYKFRSSS